MKIDLDKIEQAAHEATPGPWQHDAEREFDEWDRGKP
jgi:hypothetical protein